MAADIETSAEGVRSAIEALFSAFVEDDPLRRDQLLAKAVELDVVCWSRSWMTESLQELSSVIGQNLEKATGQTMHLIDEVQTFRDVARVAWERRSPEGYLMKAGESYFEFGEEDLLRTVVNFSDPPNYHRFAGGPQAYVDAWNTDTEQDARVALANKWATDGRWVELKFDVNGPQAMAKIMNAAIQLSPVGELMDVISIAGKGSQIRFQVDVTHRSGEKIGTFTDFVELDTDGLVTRLGGFRGASLIPDRSRGTVDPDWQWSYAAGYFDSSGDYAGGSEVMHVIPHKGKLYAANGYWEDSHWVVPDGVPKQSTQVLRLDSSDGTWEVDLDMGKESSPDLNFMKGNILKSVTFTKDGDGNDLSSPQNLLVMSAGTIISHVCVWVRDDSTENWAHQVVHSGQAQKSVRGKPGTKRWVPRAMEMHTDRITGQERIFLVLGNPGIISGVYDPNSPTKIRWDQEVEFPKNDFLDVRPLGMTVANGVLYFSGGGTIYQRNDGPEPSYSEVLTLEEELDVEMGGIRGLSAIDNPNGEGHSLIFMWIPNREVTGQINRLDPDGNGGFTVHREVETRDLINTLLGGDVVRRSVLGAYSEFYPLKDPVTGETVHLIGFQARVDTDPSHICYGFYSGGMYAIRTADQKYHVGEINGSYSAGKPVLKGPRSFALSPFGDDRLFVGGNDTNFIPSTDMAWIFSADLDVWFRPLRSKS